MGDAATSWFTQTLDTPCRLVRFSPTGHRPVTKYTPLSAQARFSDGYPVLVTSVESLQDLNRRLTVPVAMDTLSTERRRSRHRTLRRRPVAHRYVSASTASYRQAMRTLCHHHYQPSDARAWQRTFAHLGNLPPSTAKSVWTKTPSLKAWPSVTRRRGRFQRPALTDYRLNTRHLWRCSSPHRIGSLCRRKYHHER